MTLPNSTLLPLLSRKKVVTARGKGDFPSSTPEKKKKEKTGRDSTKRFAGIEFPAKNMTEDVTRS